MGFDFLRLFRGHKTSVARDVVLFNTLSRKKELFRPISPGIVRLYDCGPTVYDYVHIGNLRAYVFADTLRRVLETSGYAVTQAINITDVGHLVSDGDLGEDKMTKGLKREGKPLTLEAMRELSGFYMEGFKEDLAALNINPARVTFPRASDYIKEQVRMVQVLESKGFTYATSDGLYFDTSKLPEYGKLGGLPPLPESRIGAVSEKRSHRDFALWKFNPSLGWESPWGKGFPGWHLECSAMIESCLGDTIDIHTGGIDHIPTHHNNEIAQSETAHVKPLANFWMHGAFLNIEGEKVAKSLGNTFALKDLVDRGFSPLSYRYLLLTAHYRTPIDFTWESLKASSASLDRLRAHISGYPKGGNIDKTYVEKFLAAVTDDLNTARGIALAWDLVKDNSVSPGNKRVTLFEFDRVLGLGLSDPAPKIAPIPDDVKELVKLRDEARKTKNWNLSDRLRDEIAKKGYSVKDSTEGQVVTKLRS